MKRRGFLGMLFGASAAVAAGKAVAELPALAEVLESEPEPEEASEALQSYGEVEDDSMCSVVAYPCTFTCIAPEYPPKRRR